MNRTRRTLMGLAALGIAGTLWLCCLHLFFARSASDFYQPQGLSPIARVLAARHLQLWTEPRSRERALKKMRASNEEWDFMGRSFLAWSLANMSLSEPDAKPS